MGKRFGLVAGEQTVALRNILSEQLKINMDENACWETIDDLITAIINTSGNVLSNLQGVLVLDYAFKGIDFTVTKGDEMAHQVIHLQNTFNSQHISGVKLYVLTESRDSYNVLKTGEKLDIGVNGVIYEDVHIILLKETYSTANIKSTVDGEYDKVGLYYTESDKYKDSSQILKEQSESLLKETEIISKERLEYGKYTPTRVLSEEDFADSKKTELKIREEKRRKQMESNSRKQGNTPSKQEEIVNKRANIVFGGDSSQFVHNSPTKNEPREEYINNNSPKLNTEVSEDSSLTSSITSFDDGDTELKKLISLYSSLKLRNSDIPKNKLSSDRGIISFVGKKGSGTSGVVAQMAELYASCDRKVIILDLDLSSHSQTIYFPNFDSLVSKGKGDSLGITKLSNGVNLQRLVTPVTSMIDLVSNSRVELGTFKPDIVTNVSIGLVNTLKQLRNKYDIILLDCPLDYLSSFSRGVSFSDRIVFVTTNKYYDIDDLFAIELKRNLENNPIEFEEMIQKSSVLLNKYERGMRDDKGYELTIPKLKQIMAEAGQPFDGMLFIGEIPYFDDWEIQYLTNLRYIWKDLNKQKKTTFTLYKNILSRVLV